MTQTSARPGMGAVPFDGGVTFRVWAPFASAVAVGSGFNGWSPDADALAQENGGYWSADVAGAAVGDAYKFIVTGAANPWKTDPYALVVTNADATGNGVVASSDFSWNATGYVTPPWNEMVIYELHVGSFLVDPANPGGHGVFAGVVDKLDYLAGLGVNALQVMPADEFSGGSSWGYNPSDIFAIETLYGGPSAFAALVDAAHARGIAVIYDVVYNHFGPGDLFLWQFDGWSENGGGGVYFYNDWRKATPWGDTRPDYGRREVRQFIRDNALHWLEQHRCDGLRFDATGWIRNVKGDNGDPGADLPDGWSLLQWLNTEIDSRQPWKIAIAEDMQDDPRMTLSVAEGGAGFDAQWGAGFLHGVRDAVIPPDDSGRDMAGLARVVAQGFNGQAFQRVVYTESHDEVAASAGQARVPELIWPGAADSGFSQKRSTLGAALVFTSPGIPMIFMGQEFLAGGAWSDATPLDWTMADRFAGIVQLYRDLIRLRRDLSGVTGGLKGPNVNVHHVNDADKVIAFHRWDRGGPCDDVVVLANFANRTYPDYRIGLPRGGMWRVRLNSDWRGYSPAFTDQASDDQWADGSGADGLGFSAGFGLAAYAFLILSQDA